MSDPRGIEIMELHNQMKVVRSHFEQVWRDIDERINPQDIQFGTDTPVEPKGQQRRERVFDATPGLALDRFKAALHSLITPRNQMWSKLKPVDSDLADNSEVVEYLEEVNRRLFAARYAGNFDSEVQGAYYGAGKFGSFAMFVGEIPGKALFYRAVPMKQLYFAENEYGNIDLVHREWPWTARQAYQRWGDRLPSFIQEAARRTPNKEFMFLHCVKPRKDMDPDRRDYKGMPYASYYVCCSTNEVIEEGGFRSFPYAVGRYDLNPGEVYGRSPCMTILPDVKMLNEMNRTTIQAAQLQVLPPLLAHRDGILDAIRLTPAAINYGGVDDQGRQLVQPLNVGGDVGLGLDMMDQKRAVINDALLQTLFQILVDKPNITATEAMLRAQEKGQLIGPTGSRIETEFLSPMQTRELDILSAANQLPPMPDILLERGGFTEIEYDNPLSRAREAEGGVAILRTFEQLAPIAQVAGAAAYKRFNIDSVTKELARLNGVPQKVMFSDDEMEEVDAQAAEAAQAKAMLDAAPVAADAAKNLAQAQSLAGAAPSQVLPNIFGT